jgi:hypothetical protein
MLEKFLSYSSIQLNNHSDVALIGGSSLIIPACPSINVAVGVTGLGTLVNEDNNVDALLATDFPDMKLLSTEDMRCDTCDGYDTSRIALMALFSRASGGIL